MLTRKQIDALKTIVVAKNKATSDLTRRVLWYLIESSEGGKKDAGIILEVGDEDHQFRPRDIVLIEMYFNNLLNEVIYLNTLCELAGTEFRFLIDVYRDKEKREHKVFSFRDRVMPVLKPSFITYQELAKADLNIPEALKTKR